PQQIILLYYTRKIEGVLELSKNRIEAYCYKRWAFIKDHAQGSALYNRSMFGIPAAGGGLVLSLVEAAYLFVKGTINIIRIDSLIKVREKTSGVKEEQSSEHLPSDPLRAASEIKGMSFKLGNAFSVLEFLRYCEDNEKNFHPLFCAYSDLKNIGAPCYLDQNISLPHPAYTERTIPVITAYKRASETKKSRKKMERDYLCIPLSEHEVVNPEWLFENAERERCIIAVVDSDSDVTYYQLHNKYFCGSWPVPDIVPARLSGCQIGDTVYAQSEKKEDQHLLEKYGFISRAHGCFVFSVFEKDYLSSLGIEFVECAPDFSKNVPILKSDLKSSDEYDKSGSTSGCVSEGKTEEGDSPQYYAPQYYVQQVYNNLRARGLLPRTGFKYGTHFRAYEGHPDNEHAKYLVHVLLPYSRITWQDISRAVRLAHGVKKTIYFAFFKTPVSRMSDMNYISGDAKATNTVEHPLKDSAAPQLCFFSLERFKP
ncbi:MAG: tRNA-intron lyase, partial [Thermoplasmata archaeon]